MAEPALEIRPFAADDLARLQEVRSAAFEPIFKSFRDGVGPGDVTDLEQACPVTEF